MTRIKESVPLRSHILSVRLTEVENEELERRAASMSMTPSGYVRWCAVQSGRPLNDFETEALHELREFIQRLASRSDAA